MNFPLTWAEIDLKAINHNIKELRQITDANARLMAVVKANAYGHGAFEIAEQALKSGAETLGVARIGEAIELRKSGFDVPILIFGYTSPHLAEDLIKNNLTQTIYSYDTARAFSKNAVDHGEKIKVHLKIDTGMGRIGLLQSRTG